MVIFDNVAFTTELKLTAVINEPNTSQLVIWLPDAFRVQLVIPAFATVVLLLLKQLKFIYVLAPLIVLDAISQ